jgi:hypothetical protein
MRNKNYYYDRTYATRTWESFFAILEVDGLGRIQNSRRFYFVFSLTNFKTFSRLFQLFWQISKASTTQGFPNRV